MLYHKGHFLAPDTGSGGGAAGTPAAADGSGDGQGNQAGETPSSTADAAGNQSQAEGNSGDEKRFTQAELDRIVKERLEREKARAEKEAEKAKKEAEMASLAEQQQFQQLAVKRQEQIAELESQLKDLENANDTAEKYKKALVGYRDALLEGVPDSVKELLKGMDVADQLDWLGKNAEQFKPQENGRPGLVFPNTPNAAQKGSLGAEEKRRQAFKPRL